MKRIAIVLTILLVATIGAQAPSTRSVMVMNVDWEARRISWDPALPADANAWYATDIAPRVAVQVQAMLANLPPAGVSVAAMKAEIALAEKRMWEKMQAADVNNVRLLEQQMLLRARTSIDARLNEMEVAN